jgi:arylsulfatase
MKGLSPHSIVSTLNKSLAITAEVVVPDQGAEGTIFAIGGLTGGYSLYTKDGKPKYCYNFCGLRRYFVEGAEAIPAGTHQVRMEFAYDGGGVAKGGRVSLFIDGRNVGEGQVDMTQPFAFSADETADVGAEMGSPVSPDYGPRDNAFNGVINWVELDVDKDAVDADHVLLDAERFRVAMALQ